MFEQTRFRRPIKAHRRCLRAVDATTVEEPGASGTDWRVHYSVTLPDLTCDFFAVTNAGGAETFERIPVDRGDILLGDRAYCHREAVARVVKAGGDVIVRLNLTNFPLLLPKRSTKPAPEEERQEKEEEKRKKDSFDILAHLRTLEGFKPHSWPVRFVAKGKRYRGRLCAVRKTEEATLRAQERARKESTRKGKNIQAATLEAAGYVFVFTTLRQKELPLRDVLELYRARWQIELVFKRLKSLLRLGALPKRTDASSRAWLQAKLLTALLVEQLAERARLFSPWGHDTLWTEIPSPQPVAGDD
jgi:IS4 transposase